MVLEIFEAENPEVTLKPWPKAEAPTTPALSMTSFNLALAANSAFQVAPTLARPNCFDTI